MKNKLVKPAISIVSLQKQTEIEGSKLKATKLYLGFNRIQF